MITQRHFTLDKFLETITGVVLLAVAITMRLVPPGMRDDSGEAYIMIACFLIIGCWLLLKGLFSGNNTSHQLHQ